MNAEHLACPLEATRRHGRPVPAMKPVLDIFISQKSDKPRAIISSFVSSTGLLYRIGQHYSFPPRHLFSAKLENKNKT